MKRYVSIDLTAMKNNGLNMEKWALCETIQYLSNNKYQACFASIKSLGESIGVSESTARRIIKSLNNSGFIKRDEIGNLFVTEKWLRIVQQNDANLNETVENNSQSVKMTEESQYNSEPVKMKKIPSK